MLGTGWFFSEAPASGSSLPMADEDWFESGALPLEWTLARSTEALGRATDGRWACYAVNVPRPWHDPATLAYKGILVEAAPATQLIYQSRSSTGAVGIVANAANTTVNSTIASPFGIGVTRIIPDTTAAQHGFNLSFGGSQAAAVPDGSTVALRLVLKPTGTTYTFGRLFLRNRANIYTTITFQLTGAGSIVSISSSSATARITPDTDGFYSLEVTMNFGAGTTAPMANLLVLPDSLANSFTPNGTSGFYLAYLGAELGSSCTSPILTDGTTTVTRAADTMTSASDWLRPGTKSFGIRYTPLTSSAHTVFHGSGPDLIELRRDVAGQTVYAAVSAGTTAAQIFGATPGVGAEQTAVVVAGADQFRLAVDGAVLGTDSSGAPPTNVPTFRIGAGAGGANGGALLLRHAKYWSRTLSASEAQAFSGDLSIVGGVVVDLPTVEIQATRTATPAETLVTLVATLTGEPTGPRMTWRTVDGAARAGVDYIAAGGTLQFMPGAHSAELTVLLGDRSAEDDRWFAIELVGPAGAVLGNRRCVVTLQAAVRTGPPADIQALFGATLPVEWSLTRSTSGRYRDENGMWVLGAVDAARHHHIAPGISGLLVQSMTSEQRIFDSVDPGWTVTGSTKVIDTVTQTAWGTRSLIWRKTDGEVTHSLAVTLTSANADMPTGEYSLALYVRPLGERFWKLRLKGIDNVWREVLYDLQDAGAVVSADSGTIARVTRDSFFPEWYELFANRSQAATAGVSAEIELFPTDGFGNPTAGGGSGLGIDVGHIQLEPGAAVGVPVVPASGTTAKIVRTPDTLKATGTWYQRQSYSLGLRYVRLLDKPATQTIAHVRDSSNSTTADAQSLLSENGTLILRPRVNSATLTPVTDGTLPVGQIRTTLLTVDHTSKIALYDSGTKVGETPLTVASLVPTVLRVGSTEPFGSNGASWLLQAAYMWNSPLNDADAALFSGNLAHVPPTGEAPLPVVSIPTALSVAEGATLAVPITKTGTGACSVRFRTRALSGQATFAVDYTGVDTVVTFLSSDTVKTVNVVTLADAVVDPGETLSMLLELPTPAPDPVQCTLGNASGTVTILEQPRLTISSAASVEEGQSVTITVAKVGAGACSVTYQTQAITATAGSDYTGISATTLSFASGDTSKTITVTALADATTEGDETFRVLLSSPVGCTISNAECLVTINATGGGSNPGTTYVTSGGFATGATGGLGRPIYRVTSLADTNTQGTLRHALSTAASGGGRMIVFEVGGVIKVTDRINVHAANTTIAGETAPPPGIVLQAIDDASRQELNDPIIVFINCPNFVMSHITFEQVNHNWRVTDSRADGFGAEPGAGQKVQNLWIDHCATFWSNDEAASFWHAQGSWDTNSRLSEISITNTMFAEPLWKSETWIVNGQPGGQPHWEDGAVDEPTHNFNLLLGYRVRNCDVQYCMFAEADWRNPWIDCATTAVLANNLSLNVNKSCAIQMNDVTGSTILSVLGYLVISGPNTPNVSSGLHVNNVRTGADHAHKIHASGLYAWKGAGATYTPSTTVTGTSAKDPYMVSTRPIDTPTPTVILSAQQIYDRAVDNVGPRPKERQIPSVARAITKLRNKSGKWVRVPEEFGGPSVLTPTTRSLGTEGGSSPGTFPSGKPIPGLPTSTNTTAMKAWLRAFKDEVQLD